MKKAIISMTIIALLAIGLTACNDTTKKNENNENNEKIFSGEVTQVKVEEVKEETNETNIVSGEVFISGEETIEVNNNEENIVVKEQTDSKNKDYTVIKFSDMYETKNKVKNVSTVLKNLNGKKVQIKGYPAVQSPLDESFVYLNNQPFVTCPFCTIGDVTKLEVIPIFMADGSKIKYTENAISVIGKLEIAEKVDSEGYTTQFRIYADKVEEIKDSNANKAVNDYYKTLSEQGMIYDIQTLQMNIEYASNPEYMEYYDEKLQNGTSKVMDQVAVLKAISEEYLGYDSQYGGGFNSGYTYLDYIKECPEIVKMCEPKDERLISLNNELIKLYEDEIKILEKYQDICYKINALGNNLDTKQAGTFIKQLQELNSPNMKQYNAFTQWNNKLRE